MGRKSLKSERQKEIIVAFYKVAQREGLENASLAKVAKETGVNSSLISHYFGSKEDLIFGLINYILERYKFIYTSASVIEKGENRLEKLIDNLFSRKWNELIDDGVFYSCFTLIFRDEKIKAAFKELHDYLRLLLTEVIEEANKKGETTIENPKETADLIFVLVEGAYYYLSLYDVNEEYYGKLNRYRQTAYEILKIKNYDASRL
jgi:AcrR family transcriptional regulator